MAWCDVPGGAVSAGGAALACALAARVARPVSLRTKIKKVFSCHYINGFQSRTANTLLGSNSVKMLQIRGLQLKLTRGPHQTRNKASRAALKKK